jgi:putative ABC transport system permease protein
MRNLGSDLRYAARALIARPSFTLAAVLTLALGTGITTAIFSVVNVILLKPLPFPNAEQLITLCEQHPGATADWCSISPTNVEDIAARSRAIEAIGIGRTWSYHLATADGAKPMNAGIVTPGVFTALGVRAQLGRLIQATDLIGDESLVAVLTYETWQAQFGGAADIVGRVLILDGKPVTVVGVTQPGFQLPKFETVQLWRPVHINPRDEKHRDWRGFVAYGRLRSGVSMTQARRDIAGIAAELRQNHFAATPRWDITPQSLQNLVVGNARPVLLLFLGAVGLVLLIACANVANLLLARAAGRGREIALRSALGASRRRLVSALFAESLLLALAGSMLGLLLAYWTVEAFKLLAPSGIPRIENVRLDGAVLIFAIALAGATSLVFGLAPALRASRIDLSQALREGGRSGTRRRGQLGSALVVSEIALAVVLVVGAGLLGRSFAALASWQPGFEREHLLTFSLFASAEKYREKADVAALWDRVEGELRSIPGVRAVGSASAGPLFGGRESWEVDVQDVGKVSSRWYDVSPGFFATLGVPIVRGRDLSPTDRGVEHFVAMVNETFVRRFWPQANPLGRRIVFAVRDDRAVFEVVGVVRDIPPLRPGDPVEPEMYWSNRQLPRAFSYFVVRTDVEPASIVASVRSRVNGVDRDLAPSAPQSLPDRMARELKRPRFNMIVLVTFGATALSLAAIGTYGLLSYLVSERKRELAIRMALGARRTTILGQVLRYGLVLAAAGVTAGLIAALALGKLMSTAVVGVTPRDPRTLIAAAIVMVLVAVAACALPALRASRSDPALVLSAD